MLARLALCAALLAPAVASARTLAKPAPAPVVAETPPPPPVDPLCPLPTVGP